MSIIKEFKSFVLKGNIVDLAVAVIIGAAFGKIVTALTESFIMPLISMLLGKKGVADVKFTIGNTIFPAGIFLQAVIDFVLIAIVLFAIIKVVTKTIKKEAEAPSAPSSTEVLLAEIRDELRKK